MDTKILLDMLIEAIDYSFAQTDGSYDKSLTYPVIDKVKYIKKQLKEPVSEDLGEYINELSKQFPEVSFARLSRIAVRVAKWQKEKDKKEWLDKALDFFGSNYNSLIGGGVIGAFDDKENMIEEFFEFMNDDNL